MLTEGGDENDKIKSQNAEKQNCRTELDTACAGGETGYFRPSNQKPIANTIDELAKNKHI